MRYRVVGVVCLIVSILTGTAVGNPDTLSLLTKGREAAKAGDLANAERYHREALELAEHSSDPALLAEAIGDLGGVFIAKGQLAAAKELCLKSHAILQGIKSARYLPVVLNHLGVIYGRMGNYDQAEAYFKEALKTVRNFPRPDPYEARVLNNLGAFYYRNKDLGQAEKTLKQAIAVIEKRLGEDSVELAPFLSNLAGVFIFRKKWTLAEPLLSRAFLLLQQSTTPDNVSLAGVLDNLGMMHHLRKNHVEGEKFLRQSYEIRRTLFGPENPVVLVTAVKLAGTLRDQARYGEAEKLYSDALAIYEKTARMRSYDGAIALEELAQLLRQTNREIRADDLESTAKTIRFNLEHTVSATTLR